MLFRRFPAQPSEIQREVIAGGAEANGVLIGAALVAVAGVSHHIDSPSVPAPLFSLSALHFGRRFMCRVYTEHRAV